MHHQEAVYQCSDYFGESQEVRRYFPSPNPNANITVKDRRMLCEWSYRIVELCQLDRQVAVVAIQYFDRFLATSSSSTSSQRATIALVSRREFQLASISCLIIALKNRAGMVVDSAFVSDILCQSMYTPQELYEMEIEILRALDWRLNGPTPHDFIHRFLELFPSTHSIDVVEEIMSHSERVSELAMLDYTLAVEGSPSTIALASIMGAIHRSDRVGVLDFLRAIEDITGLLHVNDTTIRFIHQRSFMQKLYDANANDAARLQRQMGDDSTSGSGFCSGYYSWPSSSSSSGCIIQTLSSSGTSSNRSPASTALF